mmetsp:Transcript_17972/g.19486  ORF Transcript_17972/g.19486 Transcript_17972/m.19486 type:complete len:369 (+) Transcript_17972:56-1162(+)
MATLPLTSAQQEDIYLYIRRLFYDVKSFDLIAPSVKMLIHDSTKLEIDPLFILMLEERYLSHQPFVQALFQTSLTSFTMSKEQKQLLQKLKVILTTTVVYLYSFHSFIKGYLYQSIDELLSQYPHFKTQLQQQYPKPDERIKELQYLLYFRNYMIIALMLIPAKSNKTFLLKVVERLEGSGKEYITGTGQKPTVNRRMDIFHQESHTPFSKKTGKKNREKQFDLMNEWNVKSNFDSGMRNVNELEEEKENGSSTTFSISLSDRSSLMKKRTPSPPALVTHQVFKMTNSRGGSPNQLSREGSFQELQRGPLTANLQFNNSLDCIFPISVEIGRDCCNAFDINEDTQMMLLDEAYNGSFTEELNEFLMNE